MTAADHPSPVLYEVADTGVALVTLNRPDRMNAWGGGLAGAFYRCMDQADADPAVRAIVLTGHGRAFCAGADMGGLDSISEASETSGKTDLTHVVGDRHPYYLTGVRKPVIAAINGACAGIGLTLALMCDVRFAVTGAKFTTAFSRRGLIGEYAITWILPRVVGWSAALDLLLSGRTFYSEEAAALGMVKAVTEPAQLMGQAVAYAEDIAAHCAPSSLAVIKRQLYDGALRELAAVSAEAEQLMHASMQRPDFIEGITAFFQKRPPNFPSLDGA